MQELTQMTRKMVYDGKTKTGRPLNTLQEALAAFVKAKEGDIHLPFLDPLCKRYALLMDTDGSLHVKTARPYYISGREVTLKVTYPMGCKAPLDTK